MAYSSSSSSWPFFFFVLVSSLCMFGMNISPTTAQLSPSFYSSSCPNVLFTIQNAVLTAISNEPRMGASLLRLHFHDCFLAYKYMCMFPSCTEFRNTQQRLRFLARTGCDASILLDDTSSFTGEKTAGPNANSVRGYDIIDTIKAQVEALCPNTVSCADILAVAARDSVAAMGGRPWIVQLGRRDAKTASKNDANTNLPPATLSLSGLITSFTNKGFTTKEMVILSGSHSIGQARCTTFRSRIHNETNIDASFATSRKASCPTSGNDNNLAPLDATPIIFDNTYYKNLVSKKGLLHSDQELFNGGSTDAQVTAYSIDNPTFLTDFAVAMVKMGNLSPLTANSSSLKSSQSWLPIVHLLLGHSFSLFQYHHCTTSAQLSSTFYASSCPNLLPTIQAAVVNAVSNEARMGASLLRLHFHDCFGCDASILLDDTSSFTGKKTAGPNANSVRGFDVIDTIKTQVEAICTKIVSCADILAVAARYSVAALGGRPWVVQLGRRDAKTASMSDANSNLPAATLGLSGLITSFSNK
ncbi:hypothetical protein MKW98_025362, partial [Papaver atlanticum]